VIIRDHHEKYDGSGYPAHKNGPDISLLARIIAVADAYDAMTADRPYRKGLSQKQAEAELLANSGKQFDPQVVDFFVNHIKNKKPKPKRRRNKGPVSSGKNQFTDYLPVFYNYY
jgi:HD-GYP domain-containing protein (c-di-GMP phosphodiesterase class II)